jgi:hypothetical protein
MFRFRGIRRFRQANGQSPRKTQSRRLALEALETRALLSGVASGVVSTSSTTQHLTLADLPAAAQQTIAKTLNREAKLTSSDPTANNYFGSTVAIDGNTAAVQGAGGVCVFTKAGSVWTQVAVLTPSDGAEYDGFGDSISIRGRTVAVGAWEATVCGKTNEGAAYVFVEPSAGWANMTQTAKLTPSDGIADEDFGMSLAVSGDTVVVGANGAAAGNDSSQGAA